MSWFDTNKLANMATKAMKEEALERFKYWFSKSVLSEALRPPARRSMLASQGFSPLLIFSLNAEWLLCAYKDGKVIRYRLSDHSEATICQDEPAMRSANLSADGEVVVVESHFSYCRPTRDFFLEIFDHFKKRKMSSITGFNFSFS